MTLGESLIDRNHEIPIPGAVLKCQKVTFTGERRTSRALEEGRINP